MPAHTDVDRHLDHEPQPNTALATITEIGVSRTAGDDTAEGVRGIADVDLLAATRQNDPDAFGELWRRHYSAGVAAARRISADLDAEDLTQESFASIYTALLRGHGPTSAFRAYLIATIRNTAAAWARARREDADDQLDLKVDPRPAEKGTSDESELALTAFASLPQRWQDVLWLTEVEGIRPAVIASRMGMTAAGVAQLAFRAREGLRQAWIQAHLTTLPAASDCRWAVSRLGVFIRGNCSPRDQAKIETHIAVCGVCSTVATEAREAVPLRRLA
ncbi:MAG: RNA polymerase subunit sigma [Microbacterium sp.]|uniref:sigma-70 family RNA polymerase sigma factor n=1 Tax=uncultured Microbacterium sp. TaxID=191216 RepID=UPI000C8919AF|nr:RNA polymerase subunit sigma [Microbacterium sp.]